MYTQKSRSEWSKDPLFKDWLVVSNNSEVMCKYCHCKIGSKKSRIVDHMNTKKHKVAVCDFSNSQSHIQFKRTKVDLSAHTAEARLALMVVKYTSINVIDHITKTIKACFTDSSVTSSVQLSRTKCADIIKNVWYP